jgi:hypothetical protein
VRAFALPRPRGLLVGDVLVAVVDTRLSRFAKPRWAAGAILGYGNVDAGYSGIVVGGSGGVNNIVNNVFAFNAQYGVSHDSACPTASRADHNVVFGNGFGATQGGCSGLDYSRGNRTTNPLFVNYPGRDLHVNAGSPAIDYALPEYSPGGDFDGRARPQSAPDAGAFERP